ncbi:MAG: GTPase Era [Gammaproteobacteria bacterium]|nr:GTPase Era [Gammaproteobacteria bacterium]
MAHCGFAALVGRPNVGKSTLLNALLGRKVSIVSPKPQTTRTRIHGVLTRPGMQIVFVDLPGIHAKQPRAINRYMNRTALASLADSDVNLFVIEALRWTDEDERALAELKAAGRPILLLINKVDRAKPKERLLPFIEEIHRKAEFAEVVPLSALKRSNLDRLPAVIAAHLPESPLLFPPDQVTDASDRFMAAEIIREKLTRRLQEEVPYGLVVEVEGIGEAEDEPGKLVVQAVIWVERTGQKAIVIGKGGELLKEIGRAARLELREHFGKPVHLELWVKVREGWSDDENALRKFGYET